VGSSLVNVRAGLTASRGWRGWRGWRGDLHGLHAMRSYLKGYNRATGGDALPQRVARQVAREPVLRQLRPADRWLMSARSSGGIAPSPAHSCARPRPGGPEPCRRGRDRRRLRAALLTRSCVAGRSRPLQPTRLQGRLRQGEATHIVGDDGLTGGRADAFGAAHATRELCRCKRWPLKAEAE
jgi:hypothetical protein